MKIEIKNIEAQYQLILQQNPKANFKIILSGATRKIIHNEAVYTNMFNKFSFKELLFIKKVRTNIISNCEAYEAKNGSIPKYECSYVDWSNNIPINCENICEIDLNAAYWEIAFQSGYISPEIYNEGFNFRKKIRLVSLGSIAKNEKIIEYKDGEYFGITENRHKYAKIFFNISRYVYDIMNICKDFLGKDYLFFWVDAIFFKNSDSNRAMIHEILNDAEMKFKTYHIKKLEFDKKLNIVKVSSDEHSANIRQFNLKKEMKF